MSKHILLTGETIVPTGEVTPIVAQVDHQQQWNIDDVYTGGVTDGRYVPNVNDIVNDYLTGQYWVTAVSEDYIPVLEKWPKADSGDETGTLDQYIGRQRTQEAYGVYIDTSVFPYRLVVDNTLLIGGAEFEYCRIFLGSDTDEDTGIIVSRWLENDEITGDSFPLELVATDNLNNQSIKVVQPGWCNYKLDAGSTVTAVFYDGDMKGYKILPLRVFESAVVRDTSVGDDIITGINIESPFLDEHDGRQINLPMNMTVDSLDLYGRVFYKSGKSVILPVDGTKFALDGKDMILATSPGESFPVVLRYNLSELEYTNAAVNAGDYSMKVAYKVVTQNKEQQYSVKLFMTLHWSTTDYKYEPRYWLYSLDRATPIEVTKKVYNAGVNTALFDGDNYTTTQDLYLAVNLDEVYEGYPAFKHVEHISVTLLGPYDTATVPFTMSYTGDDSDLYGNTGVIQLHQEAANPYLYVGKGFTYQAEFQESMYNVLQPMYDSALEQRAPTPTHFRLVNDNGIMIGEWTMDNFNKVLSMQVVPDGKDLLTMQFFIRNAETDLHLTTAPVRVESIGVPSSPIIVQQPETDVYAKLGEAYTISVEVEYEGQVTYQWVHMGSNGIIITRDDVDNTDTIIKYLDKERDDLSRWYCEITDEQGNMITSDVSVVHLLL